MQLTFEQKIASSFDRNISVTANAGSGKTKVLVDRYIDILTESEKLNKLDSSIKICKDPSEIVAITFTTKAATEMKEKINRILDEKIMQNPNSKSLINLRNKMIYANVSTIHSFCNKLMREYPIEAEVIPNYADLSEAETNELIDSKIRGFIREKTSETEFSDEIEDKNLEKLIFYFGKKKLIGYLTFLVKNEYELLKLKEFYDKKKDILLDEIHNSYVEEYAPKIEEKRNNLKQVIEYYETAKISDGARIKFPDLKSKHSEFESIVISEFNTFKQSIKCLSDLSNYDLITKEFKIHKGKISKCEDYSDKLEGLKELSDLNSILELSDLDEDLIFYAVKLVDYAVEILNQINEEKDKLGKYNFEDMMIRALKVLNSDIALADLKSKIKYLMIDEFQDTNALQYELVKKLVASLDNPKAESPNLFIVGDTKQSIYGFRKADVRVFARAMEEIKKSNSVLLGENTKQFTFKEEIGKVSNQDLLWGKSKLTTTFRLQPVIGAFLNDLFANIMIKNESDYSVEYENFVIGRNADKDNADKLGTVNFLLVENKKKENDKEETETDVPNANEMALVADKIYDIVNIATEENKFLIQDGENYKRAKYSDIFVLSRKKADLFALSEELRLRQIPFVLNSGAGFFATQEIQDMIAYLNFIINKNDDIAFLSVLRSKMFEFTDNEIFILRYIKTENNYYEKLRLLIGEIDRNQINIKGIDVNKIKFAFNFLEQARTLAPSRSIQAIIRNVIEKTFYLSKFCTDPRFEQIYANIEKLIEDSRDYEKPGFLTMYDFIRELNFKVEREDTSGEAAVLTGENAVNLMTIHGSKGLDAAVVFVISCSSQTKNNNNNIITNDKYGVVFHIPDLDSKDAEYVKTPLFSLAKKEENESLEAEEIRLLYVALTRAKDHLFISSKYTLNKPDKNNPNGKLSAFKGFYKLIDAALRTSFDIDLSDTIDKFDTPYQTFNIDKISKLDVYCDGKNSSLIPFKYNINFELYKTEQEILQSSKSQKKYEFEATEIKIAKEFTFFFDDIQLMFSEENYSPSQIHAFEDKDKFIANYVYGLKPEKFEVKKDNEFVGIGANQYNAMAKGTAIHYLFEKVENWYSENIEIASVKDTLDIYPQKDELSDKQIDDIFSQILTTAKTNLFKHYAKNLENWQHEVNFRIPYKNDFFKGVIDLVLLNEDGNYEVWDWKSNKIHSREYLEEIAKKDYEFQMKFYCFILSKLYQTQDQFSAKLIFTQYARIDQNNFYYEFKWNRADLENFEEEISNNIKEIKKYYL